MTGAQMDERAIEETVNRANALFGALAGAVESAGPDCEVTSIAIAKLLAAISTFYGPSQEAAHLIVDAVSELAEEYVGNFYSVAPAGKEIQ
jgi:hypothetical protein